jgi:ligand-binding sensor domain-containing protein
MAGTVLFIAGSDQISSLGVIDVAQDAHGDLYFATDNGLSIYDGAWHITHMTYGNPSYGLLSDHILAVEFDAGGNLWLGYPDGLQRIEGEDFVTIRDQQLLKSLDIHSLLFANGRMWVAAGTSGLHRYDDGIWEWFRPGGPEGLGCSYVTSMAGDAAGETLYVACNEGIWSAKNTDEPVVFTPFLNGLMTGSSFTIRSDPFGGIYIFNSSAILHFTPPDRWRTVVISEDLMPGIGIADVGVDPDQTLWIATNYGIYAWKDGKVRDRLHAGNGIRNNAVKKLYIDAEDRLWFVTPENVGFFQIARKREAGNPVIPITTYSVPTTIPVPSPVETPLPPITPAISIREIRETPTPTPSSPLAGLLDAIRSFFGVLFHR